MGNHINFSELKVETDPENYGTTEISAYSAKISHDKRGRSALEIAADELGFNGREDIDEQYQEKLEEKVGDFLEKLAKAGHTSTFYQSNEGLNYQVPRHTTMFLCQFDYPKYLQQSQRYTKAEEFITELEDNKDVKEIYERAHRFYNKMISDEGTKIRKEDARYILPLGTAAKHIHQNLNFVSLANIYREIEKEDSRIPSISKKAVDEGLKALNHEEPVVFNKKLIDIYNENDKGYTVTNMFSETNKAIENLINGEKNKVLSFCADVDFQSNEYKESFLNLSNYGQMNPSVTGFLTSMSLSAWHQFMRNDAVKQSVQSIYDAAEKGEMFVPESIVESEYIKEFEKLFDDSMNLYSKLREDEGDDAIELVPHALGIDVAFSIDYFNFKRGFIADRKHGGAQWEIREIAKQVDQKIRHY